MSVKWFGDSSHNNIVNSPVERKIARYVHSGNPQLIIASLDIATGIFTTSNAMTGSPAVGTIINMAINFPGSIPTKLFSEWNSSNNNYGLEYITSTTFYVVNQSSANARIASYAAAQGVDLTSFVFEYNMATNIPINFNLGLAGTDIRTFVAGVRDRPGYTTVQLNFTYASGSSNISWSMADGRETEFVTAETIYKYISETGLLTFLEGRSSSRLWGGSSWTYSAGAGAGREFYYYPNLKWTSAMLTISSITNGTCVEIYSR